MSASANGDGRVPQASRPKSTINTTHAVRHQYVSVLPTTTGMIQLMGVVAADCAAAPIGRDS
jgi:hypothetical protein